MIYCLIWSKRKNKNWDLSHITDRGTSPWPRKSDGRSHRRQVLRRQPDSLDSVDSCLSVSSHSSLSHYQPSSSSSSATTRRFRFHSKSPSQGSGPAQSLNTTQAYRSDSLDDSPTRESVDDEMPQFTSRGTFNPEKGKQKLKATKQSLLRREGAGSDPPDMPQQMVMYGSNEFMVWRTLGHQSIPYPTPCQVYICCQWELMQRPQKPTSNSTLAHPVFAKKFPQVPCTVFPYPKGEEVWQMEMNQWTGSSSVDKTAFYALTVPWQQFVQCQEEIPWAARPRKGNVRIYELDIRPLSITECYRPGKLNSVPQ